MPRGWRCLPTAWIHFLVVECVHVYLAVFSWRNLVTNVQAQYLEVHYKLRTGPIEQYAFELLFFGTAGEARLGNERTRLLWPAAHFHGLDFAWLVLCWTLPVGAGLLLVYILSSFVRRQFWSFEDAAYVHFTWHLPRQRPYRCCVGLMALGPVLMPMFWLWNVVMYTSGHDFSTNVLLMRRSALSGFFLLFSLNLLAFPTTPVHDWRACPDFLALRFRRSLLSLLLSRNASFGMKFMDALWTATSGDTSRLSRYLADPGESDRVLGICRRALECEARYRKETELARLQNDESTSSTAEASEGPHDDEEDKV